MTRFICKYCDQERIDYCPECSETNKTFYIITSNESDDKISLIKTKSKSKLEIFDELEETRHNFDINMVLNETQFKELKKGINDLK